MPRCIVPIFIVAAAAGIILPLASLLAAPAPETEAARKAVERALPLIQKSSAEYTRQRGCFSCHHQTMPLLALSLARKHGFPVDEQNLQEQAKFTEASLRAGRDAYRQGRGQGGQAVTAVYGLLALEVGEWKPDETTGAVTEYVLLRDAQSDHWRTSSNRPPSETTDFTATALALRALRVWASPEQKERAAARVEKARGWLLAAPARDTEERVFRLWGLKDAGAEEGQVRQAARELLESRRSDGGWSQTPDLESDAYATGSALVALCQAGGLTPADPVYQRGAAFLAGSQEPDGSWRVKSRSTPFQPYFESGFPHGKDQFISISATCWATAALALASPVKP